MVLENVSAKDQVNHLNLICLILLIHLYFLNSSVAARSFQSSNFEIGNNSSFSLNLNIPTTSSDFAQEYAKEKQVSTKFFSNSDIM